MAPTASSHPTTASQRYPARALVVDDTRASRVMVQHVLRERGIQTWMAVDGRAGWLELQTFGVDLVITDVEMPHWTGVRLVQAIRNSSNPRIHNTAVIVTSSNATDAVVEAVCRYPQTYFMTKPMRIQELDIMLRLIKNSERLRMDLSLTGQPVAPPIPPPVQPETLR